MIHSAAQVTGHQVPCITNCAAACISVGLAGGVWPTLLASKRGCTTCTHMGLRWPGNWHSSCLHRALCRGMRFSGAGMAAALSAARVQASAGALLALAAPGYISRYLQRSKTSWRLGMLVKAPGVAVILFSSSEATAEGVAEPSP